MTRAREEEQSRQQRLPTATDPNAAAAATTSGQGKDTAEESQSKRRRNRRNRRQKDKAEQQSVGAEVEGVDGGQCDRLQHGAEKESAAVLSRVSVDTKSGNTCDNGNDSGDNSRVKHQEEQCGEWNGHTADSSVNEEGRRKKLKSFGEVTDTFWNSDSWKPSPKDGQEPGTNSFNSRYNTSEEYDSR